MKKDSGRIRKRKQGWNQRVKPQGYPLPGQRKEPGRETSEEIKAGEELLRRLDLYIIGSLLLFVKYMANM